MDLYEQPRRQEYRHWLNSQPDTTPTIQPRRFSGNEQPVTTLDTALRNTSVVQNTGSLSQTPPYTVSHHLPSQDEIRRNAGDAAEVSVTGLTCLLYT
jgi:hypothetical protein